MNILIHVCGPPGVVDDTRACDSRGGTNSFSVRVFFGCGTGAVLLAANGTKGGFMLTLVVFLYIEAPEEHDSFFVENAPFRLIWRVDPRASLISLQTENPS